MFLHVQHIHTSIQQKHMLTLSSSVILQETFTETHICTRMIKN